jgi:outer membrane protein
MCQPRAPTVVMILSVSLAGCATSALEMAPPQPDRPWVPATTATGEIIPGARASSRPTGGATYVLPANSELANVPPSLDVERGRIYSLPELIDIAQSNNPSTRIAWNSARDIALAAGIAESAYLPRLTASVIRGYQTSQDQNSSTLGVSNVGTANASVSNSLTANGTISSGSLQWLLFDFGQRAAIVDAAKQASVISNIAFTAVHQQVIYDVSLAFYAHAAARARVNNAAQSLKNTQAVQAAVEARLNQGIGTATELAQARQATAQARLVMVQAQGGAQNAYLTLISAMGISPLTKIKVADISGRKLSPAMVGSIETVISAALARRPDVLTAYAAQKASLSNVRAAESEFLPKVFVAGTGSYSSGGLSVSAIPSIGDQSATLNVSGTRASGIVFAGATLPLYDGGTRAAALKQTEAKADNANLTLIRTRHDAVRQIVLAENALRTSLSAYSAATSLASAAQTTFDSALTAYRSGAGSITELTLAQTQLLLSKSTSTDAYSIALSAAATLALSTGSLGAPSPGRPG